MYGYGYRYNSGLVIGAGGGAPFSNNSSLLFDGVNDYVDCGVIATLQSTTQYSLSCWFKTSDITKNQGILKWWYDFSNWIEISFFSSLIYVIPGTSSGNGTYPTTSILNNTWYNIVMVFNGSATGNSNRLKAYLNGVELILTYNGTIQPTSPNLIGGTFKIGERYTGTDYFLGNIDEVSIYDYPLNSAEALAIGGTIPTDLSLLSTPPTNWYRNGDGVTAFPTIPDVIGTNNGTAYNENEATMIVSDVPL